MGQNYDKDQFKRICCWCGFGSFLGIGMSYSEFRAGFAKAKNKQQYEDEVERTLSDAMRKYIRCVGRDVFTNDVEQFNQTLPKKVKKRRPETWLMWAGFGTRANSNREKYYDYMNRCFDDDSDLGLSYDSWSQYC